MNKQIKNITLSAFFLALGLVLPFVTGQIPEIGTMLLPMHIPVLLCGFICGKEYGLLIGLILPLLRHALFSMPPINVAITMTFELAAYGFFSGLIYNKLSKNLLNTYIALISSMLIGRLALAIAEIILYSINGTSFVFTAFISSAFISGIPGIILQLILIPFIIRTIGKKHA